MYYYVQVHILSNTGLSFALAALLCLISNGSSGHVVTPSIPPAKVRRWPGSAGRTCSTRWCAARLLVECSSVASVVAMVVVEVVLVVVEVVVGVV